MWCYLLCNLSGNTKQSRVKSSEFPPAPDDFQVVKDVLAISEFKAKEWFTSLSPEAKTAYMTQLGKHANKARQIHITCNYVREVKAMQASDHVLMEPECVIDWHPSDRIDSILRQGGVWNPDRGVSEIQTGGCLRFCECFSIIRKGSQCYCFRHSRPSLTEELMLPGCMLSR